jgi:hypothetical protein
MDSMHPLQAMVNGWSAAWQKERASTQMTLGKLIALLETLPPERVVRGLGEPDSYRGYYSDLAFEPEDHEVSVAALLAKCRECMGEVFHGYKGGEYVMGAKTPLWVAPWGSTGTRLMGLDTDADPIRPITADEED